jgi:hypothetical protein
VVGGGGGAACCFYRCSNHTQKISKLKNFISK